jgi:hypothetical protein
MKLRVLRQLHDRDTWKQKTLNPSNTYILHEDKILKVETMCPWMGWDDFYRWIETMEEVE